MWKCERSQEVSYSEHEVVVIILYSSSSAYLFIIWVVRTWYLSRRQGGAKVGLALQTKLQASQIDTWNAIKQ